MAFEKRQNEISKMLKASEAPTASGFDNYERTKQYQFTLQPSVRQKINDLAKAKGYRSASSFLNDFFKNIE